MLTVFHLSDVHLALGPPAPQRALLACLRGALEHEIARRRAPADLVVITGDLFDSAGFAIDEALRTFRAFTAVLREAVGARVPILVQPGNHDRRRFGVLGPHVPELFRALEAPARAEGVFVFGNAAPFLAELVPPEIHRLPVHLVAYDSTVLRRGLVSAGGVVRHEDLLQVAAEIDAAPGPRLPLVVLMHHHLVPTPLTDLDRIGFERLPRYLRWPMQKGLPHLVAHADREELTMTALGAGTALSALHSLGRPVLVLHGHKHYPTARLLESLAPGEGDVLLGSAGSAGSVQLYRATDATREARIWPSFNAVTLDGPALTIESVAFSEQKPNKPPRLRTLVAVAQRGARWELRARGGEGEGGGPEDLPIALNESVFELQPPRGGAGDVWDLRCQRTLASAGAAAAGFHVEVVEGLPGGTVTIAGGAPRRLPAEIRVPRHGTVAYRIAGGVCRTVEAAGRSYGEETAYEWVGLFVRHGSRRARVVLRGLPRGAKRPFASATDLGTGQERARPLREEGADLVLEEQACAARTLLRIYWALAR